MGDPVSEILRYVLVDADNAEQEYEYDYYPDAEEAAIDQGCAVIQRTYTYDDSELVWTPDGADTWPPRGR